jgi:hypothetical protein
VLVYSVEVVVLVKAMLVAGLALVLSSGLARAGDPCDNPGDDTCLTTIDHGDYAAGRWVNETWTDLAVRRQREVERELGQDDGRR